MAIIITLIYEPKEYETCPINGKHDDVQAIRKAIDVSNLNIYHLAGQAAFSNKDKFKIIQ